MRHDRRVTTGQAGPPAEVVRAFGGRGPVVRVPGGQGTSWRAGDIALKPVAAGDEPTVRWLHQVAADVRPGGLRLALPVATPDGRAVVDGWAATPWLAGRHAAGDGSTRAAVARQFAAAFAGVDGGTLPRRTDPWAVADRVAWGEEPGPALAHPVAAALPAPRARPATVVHGDLAGNVLVDAVLAPALVDLTVYVRPVEWSVAVLAVDLVGFAGAPTTVLGSISDDRDFPELVARAAVFRMATDVLRGEPADPAYRAAADWALARIWSPVHPRGGAAP